MGPLPQTTLEQRQPLYEDIETLIATGFLSHPVTLHVPLVLRSLGPGDTFLMKARLEADKATDWRLWVLASSVWMVDGISLLGEPHAVPALVKVFRRLPQRTREILFSLVLGLFARQNRAIEGVEAYCYEPLSRFQWRSAGNQLATGHIGIPGIEQIGSNHIQRMWAFYNEVEDRRERDEAFWDGMKLVASASAPKGISKIDQRDKQLWQTEKGRRQSVQDKFYYTRMGMIPKEGPKTPDAARIGGVKSVDDLAEEMRRWVAGEEDQHDKIVSEYKRKVVEKYEREKAARERKAEQLRQQLELGPDRVSPLVGYSQAQLAQILRDRGVGTPGVRRISLGVAERREYLYTKYLEKEPAAGLLQEQDGRLVPAGKKDLTERIAGRRVAFDSKLEE